MINKIQILFAILILSAFTANAQFSIDIFYGYNYSNASYVMPQAYNYVNYQTYYSNIPIDTIINIQYPDTITNIIYEPRLSIIEEKYSNQNFATDYLYGLNINYKYASYFETGLSFEKVGLIGEQSCFEVTMKDERYDFNDIIFYYIRATHKFNYDVINASLIQSVLYSYKDFSFYANFGIKAYYTTLNHDFTYNVQSTENEMYGYNGYSINTSYSRKYSGYSFGFASGLGVSYLVYNNISVFVNVGYTWANLQFQKGQQMDYYYEHTNSLGETNTESKPELEEIAVEDIPFGAINYNSWNFRLGLCYTFQKNQKQE